MFRDTDLPGDAISEQVVRGAGQMLNEGGFACILLNWHHRDGADWDQRPQSWVSNSGCDGWLICFKSTDPLTYAADWLRTGTGQDSAAYAKHLDRWMAYYQQMKIQLISAGALVMRKRSIQKNWFRAHAIDKGRCAGSAGDQIERIFAAEDLLQSIDNDSHLLDCCLLLDDHHRLEHQLGVENGRWVVQAEHIFASEGVPFAGKVDMHIANLLAGCDGRRTLHELIAVMAHRLQADPEKLKPACLTVVRKLMQAGFLSPVGCPSVAPVGKP